MSTIPASQIVSITPNVLSAGGAALELLGMALTKNTRVPIGGFLSFPTAAAVSAFFGASSHEAALAAVYFAGFDNKTAVPAAMLFAQYPQTAVAAYLRSSNVASLGLAAIQALSGSLTVSIDGYPRTAGSLNLTSATSFSAAAALIQTGLNASPPSEASVTGSIAPETASVMASIAGNIMTVSSIASGTLFQGAELTGASVTAGTQIANQLSGTVGGVGTYAVSISQTVTSEAISASYGLLTVTVVASGTLSVGQTLAGTGVTAGTQITALGTGTGLAGTYYVNLTETVASGTITAGATPLTVTFDSVSGSFVIGSGVTGPASSAAFATGSLAAPLLMTSATGAVVSQGAAGVLPGTFMNALILQTQNWASFFTVFDPDGGSGNTQKQLFAAWTNSTQDRFAYVCWDTDVTPTLSPDAAASLGQILLANGSSGTILIYEPEDMFHAAFVSGMIASINTAATNGRITLMGKHQAGLVAAVSDAGVAANLIANGYNFYGAYGSASTNFVFFNPGSISGEFEWADSYVNQIWLNNALQQAGMTFITTINSVPYNAPGYAMIEACLSDPIAAGLNFGAIRAGVTLSAAQITEVNTAAGIKIDDVLSAQGWYLQVQPASPQVRQARQSPTILFWYCDGESVQKLNISSILVQ